jgi:murein L,D-transpeptidase YcbB/YkuD
LRWIWRNVQTLAVRIRGKFCVFSEETASDWALCRESRIVPVTFLQQLKIILIPPYNRRAFGHLYPVFCDHDGSSHPDNTMREEQPDLPISILPVHEHNCRARAACRVRSNAVFAISSLRLDRLVALTSLALLLTSAVALAEPSGTIADSDKATPNAGIATPPTPAQSEPTTGNANSTGETPQVAAPPATAAGNDKPAELPGAPAASATTDRPPPDTTATVPVTLSNPDQLSATPKAPDKVATPTPAANSDQPSAAPKAPEKVASPTPAPAANPDQPSAASSVDADAAIAGQLHDLANGRFDKIIGDAKERTAVDTFYSGRNHAPLWITDGKANARAKAAIAYLGQVAADGLDPSDYPVPNFDSLTDPTALAEAEINLTASVVKYTHHAQIGRVHWSRVSGDISYDQSAPDPAEVLSALAEAKDVGEALDTYEPHAVAYLALKEKLAEIRAGQRDADKAQIPNGPPLKIGMQDERVPLLRSRLDVADDGGTTYDKVLADAVKKFQQVHRLRSTGTLDAATLEALNGRQPDRRTDIIIANMERWRWMPHDLGKTYVIVNIPDYTLHVIHDEKQVWMTKIVVGKPSTPTPLMSAQMKSITVNPTWNIPQSIAAAEYLPLLQQDPTILQRAGLNVSYNPDGTIHLSQPPGEQNALGQIRFNFPNKFLVYQHDSNQKYLFGKDQRDDSHGCMRVQDPLKYAEVLLSIVRPGEGYTEDRIHRMFGNNEINIQFPTTIPVHLTYQTAFVDDGGRLEFRDDIYGRDRALLIVMKGPDAKVSDLPFEHRENAAAHRPPVVFNNPLGGWANRGYRGGFGFFSRLLGGPSMPPAPVPRQSVAQHRAFNQ